MRLGLLKCSRVDFAHHIDAAFLIGAPSGCFGSHGMPPYVILLNSLTSRLIAGGQMLNEKLFQDLNARLSKLIASGPTRDLEKNIRALFSGFFSRLDLVTREEFDIQSEVLRRTRQKLDLLEAKVAELESLQATAPRS